MQLYLSPKCSWRKNNKRRQDYETHIHLLLKFCCLWWVCCLKVSYYNYFIENGVSPFIHYCEIFEHTYYVYFQWRSFDYVTLLLRYRVSLLIKDWFLVTWETLGISLLWSHVVSLSPDMIICGHMKRIGLLQDALGLEAVGVKGTWYFMDISTVWP